jgi:hypothetical protein
MMDLTLLGCRAARARATNDAAHGVAGRPGGTMSGSSARTCTPPATACSWRTTILPPGTPCLGPEGRRRREPVDEDQFAFLQQERRSRTFS